MHIPYNSKNVRHSPTGHSERNICSTGFPVFAFICTLPIPEGQTGDAWELSKGMLCRASRSVGYENTFTLFLILGWGYQPERAQDGINLFFHALLASLPVLVGILFVYNCLWSLFLSCGDSSSVGGLFYVYMVCVLLVKIPVFSFIYGILGPMLRLLPPVL